MHKSIVKSASIILSCVITLLLGCSQGLAPEERNMKSGPGLIRGKIIYQGGINSWSNAPDSVIGMRAAAFLIYPLPDSAGIINELLQSRAFVSGLTSLPIFVDSSDFEIAIPKPPVTVQYLAIAQQITSDLNTQKVVGVYTTSGDNTKPSSIYVDNGDTVTVRIIVDFTNLPPQPF